MSKEYILKKNPFDKNRLLKLGKSIVDEAKEDRDMALEAHRYFKDMVERSEDTDSDAKRLMVECLKLAQNSKNSSIKIMSMMVKLEEIEGKDTLGSPSSSSVISFNELESLADAKR